MSVSVPFLLPAEPGYRFCIYHRPAGPCHANILHVPAFAEEMNKARRTVALQAHAFAQRGIGVLIMDLYGCGDSSGDFASARWDIWQGDIACGLRWLKRQADVPMVLWGLRLGVPLMLSYARVRDQSIDSLLMWQPVVSGDVHLTQFLRLRLANEMLSGSQERTGTRELKRALKEGRTLEIAGYELSPELAKSIEACKLATMGIEGAACNWFEVTTGAALLPATRAVVDEWERCGIDVTTNLVSAEPFWSTQEIVECNALIQATNRVAVTMPV